MVKGRRKDGRKGRKRGGREGGREGGRKVASPEYNKINVKNY